VGMKSFLRKLICLCCLLMFVGPFLLLIFGGHYWWNSRIYLVFPVIVLFSLALASELYFQKIPRPVSIFTEEGLS
jgi:hypothetical protein